MKIIIDNEAADIRAQLEQPLTLAYLSCVTMAMLDKNTRQSSDPTSYVTDILDTAKAMVDLVIKEQLDVYNVQLEQIKETESLNDAELNEALNEMGIPTKEGFEELVKDILESHSGKFSAYRDAIIADINTEKKK